MAAGLVLTWAPPAPLPEVGGLELTGMPTPGAGPLAEVPLVAALATPSEPSMENMTAVAAPIVHHLRGVPVPDYAICLAPLLNISRLPTPLGPAPYRRSCISPSKIAGSGSPGGPEAASSDNLVTTEARKTRSGVLWTLPAHRGQPGPSAGRTIACPPKHRSDNHRARSYHYWCKKRGPDARRPRSPRT